MLDLQGAFGRESSFSPDPNINPQHSATNRDYLKQGFDKGHLSPAADNAGDETSMRESFYLSNTAPQVPNHNRGIWKKLEDTVRREALSDDEGDRFVITGTLVSANPERMNGRVCIPSHFYKIVHYPKRNQTKTWLIPNEPISDMSLERYETTHDEIKKIIGLKFFVF